MFSYFSFVGFKKNFFITKKNILDFFLISFSYDNFFRLTNPLYIKKKSKTFLGHRKLIDGVYCPGESTYLISFSKKTTLKFWDPLSSRVFRTIIFKFDMIQKICLEIKKKILICLGSETITVWEIHKGTCLHCFPFFSGNNLIFKSLKTNNIVWVQKKSEKITIFDFKKGNVLREFKTKKKMCFIEDFFGGKLAIFFENFLILFDSLVQNKLSYISLIEINKVGNFLTEINFFPILSNYKLSKKGFFLKIIFGFKKFILDHETGLFF